MRVQQLEQMYKEGVWRLKEQMKRQEKVRLEMVKTQVREEQKALYERKLQEASDARSREMRLIQEELERICEQAGSLMTRIDGMLNQRKE